MTAPQIVWLALAFLTLGMAIEQHGKHKTGTHNFWVSVIAVALNYGLLYWGGFFG